jgi:hypothetical protein
MGVNMVLAPRQEDTLAGGKAKVQLRGPITAQTGKKTGFHRQKPNVYGFDALK